MKRLLFAVLLTLVLTFGALAQPSDDQTASKEDVQRYFAVMHSHDMMQKMVDAMAKPMHQLVHDEYVKDQEKLPADFEVRMNKIMDDMFKDMPWDEMMQAMMPAYQKHFTKGDLDSIVAFYTTPTGQKLLREMPDIMADSMQAMMPIMQKYMERVQGRIQDETVAMLKKSEPKSSQGTKN